MSRQQLLHIQGGWKLRDAKGGNFCQGDKGRRIKTWR